MNTQPPPLGSTEPPQASSEAPPHDFDAVAEALPAVGAGIDWKSIADALYPVIRACTCDLERNSAGVPVWFPMEGGGIGRKLTRRCSRCVAKEMYEAAAGAPP